MWAEIFPRYGKFILRFSMLWKNNFHGVEKMGLPALVSIQFFHSMEKSGNVRKCVIFGGEAFGRLWHHLAFD